MGMDESAVVSPFEQSAPVPAQPDKRKRVSNSLYSVLAEVNRLESDFVYQYDYNRDILTQLQQERAARVIVEKERDFAANALKSEAASRDQLSKESTNSIQYLQRMVNDMSRPSKFWKKIAVTSWLFAVTLIGVAAYDKFVQPIDSLLEQAIIYLSTSN